MVINMKALPQRYHAPIPETVFDNSSEIDFADSQLDDEEIEYYMAQVEKRREAELASWRRKRFESQDQRKCWVL